MSKKNLNSFEALGAHLGLTAEPKSEPKDGIIYADDDFENNVNMRDFDEEDEDFDLEEDEDFDLTDEDDAAESASMRKRGGFQDEVHTHESVSVNNGRIERKEIVSAPADAVIETERTIKKSDSFRGGDNKDAGKAQADAAAATDVVDWPDDLSDEDAATVEKIYKSYFNSMQHRPWAEEKAVVILNDYGEVIVSSHAKRDERILFKGGRAACCAYADLRRIYSPEEDAWMQTCVQIMENKYAHREPTKHDKWKARQQKEKEFQALVRKNLEAKKREERRVAGDMNSVVSPWDAVLESVMALEAEAKESLAHEADRIHERAVAIEAETAAILAADIVPDINLDEDPEIIALRKMLEEKRIEDEKLAAKREADAHLADARADYELAVEARRRAVDEANAKAKAAMIEKLKAELGIA